MSADRPWTCRIIHRYLLRAWTSTWQMSFDGGYRVDGCAWCDEVWHGR